MSFSNSSPIQLSQFILIGGKKKQVQYFCTDTSRRIMFDDAEKFIKGLTRCRHQQLSGKSDENKSFKPNQIVPSINIMLELYYFSLDQ